MKEELIRVEDGRFRRDEGEYRFEISIARGECIGIYVDDHFTSGTAYLDVFKGVSRMEGGRAFAKGRRVGALELERWIQHATRIVDRHRFDSRELTVRDFILALDRDVDHHRRWAAARLKSPEMAEMLERMELRLPPERRLTELSMLDYYRLCVFRVWFWQGELLILDRITEILRRRDVEKLMECVQLLLRQGGAVFLFDLDESFMYRYCDRIDVVRDRKTCYRLYPEEYGERLYQILGWSPRDAGAERTGRPGGGQEVLRAEGLMFPDMAPLDLQIHSGEIALLRDENYTASLRLRECFLGGQGWLGGTLRLDGRSCGYKEVKRFVGSEIGIQLERPDRPSGMLFDNLTALDNLTACLLPKAGRRIVRRRVVDNVLQEAERWFSREELLRPLREWPLPARLRFSYCKWYLINPKLLICFFPFAGQETAHHAMITDLLVACAERGMAVWVISSGIDAVCQKTKNEEFLRRLRYLN